MGIDLMTHESSTTPVGPRLFLKVRCRACEPCRKARASYWKLGAIAEILSSSRTWFVTGTVRPEERLRVIYAADLALAQAGVTNPTEKEVFSARVKALSPHVTRFLKRVRKGRRTEDEAALPFRYLLVWEAHTDGFPHAHLLLHEQGKPITKRRIEREWRLGFSKPKLVISVPEDIHKAAAYVCKYISKTMLCRVRASQNYGRRKLTS